MMLSLDGSYSNTRKFILDMKRIIDSANAAIQYELLTTKNNWIRRFTTPLAALQLYWEFANKSLNKNDIAKDNEITEKIQKLFIEADALQVKYREKNKTPSDTQKKRLLNELQEIKVLLS